jgi:hypothetical protein
MGRKIDHPVVVERRALHHRLAGVAAEVEVADRRAELAGNRLEFVGRVGCTEPAVWSARVLRRADAGAIELKRGENRRSHQFSLKVTPCGYPSR